jgi:hypothetical protein
MDIDWTLENEVMCYVPKPTIAVTGQKIFTTTELLTLPRYAINEYTQWTTLVYLGGLSIL